MDSHYCKKFLIECLLRVNNLKRKSSTNLNMKNLLASLVIASAMTLSVTAETSTKISDVHLCCQSCVKGVEKAVGTVSDVTATVDKDAGTVTLAGPDKAA